MFVANSNRVLSRERILELTDGNGGIDPYDRAIDMRIRRLRHKLGKDRSGAPTVIKTIRGIGYKFAPEIGSNGN